MLGGEVDTLLITNAYENVLLRALNQPLTKKPKFNYFEEKVVEEPERPINNQPKPIKKILQPKAKPLPIKNHPVDDEDEDLLLSLNFDNLICAKSTDNHSDDDEILKLENEFLNYSPKKEESEDKMEFPETPQIQTINSELLFDGDKIAQIDSLEKEKLKNTPKNHISLSTIDQFLELSNNETINQEFCIFGIVEKFTKELSISKNGNWSLSIKIIDDYSQNKLELNVNPQFLIKLIGIRGFHFKEHYQMNNQNVHLQNSMVNVSNLI